MPYLLRRETDITGVLALIATILLRSHARGRGVVGYSNPLSTGNHACSHAQKKFPFFKKAYLTLPVVNLPETHAALAFPVSANPFEINKR